MPYNPPAIPVFPFAFWFEAYQDYDHGILEKRTQRIIFEYLFGMSAYFLRYKRQYPFFHSYRTIKKRTGVCSTVARGIVESFGGHDSQPDVHVINILTTGTQHVRNAPVTTFTINYLAILKALPEIYGSVEKLEPDEVQRLRARRKVILALVKLTKQCK